MLRSKKTKENVAQAQCPTKAYRSDEYRRRPRNYKNSEVLLKGIYIYIPYIISCICDTVKYAYIYLAVITDICSTLIMGKVAC